ncbi:MAG TPA: Nramp family divalent metal transporter [Chloroflexota bacterium]|nr:Nramp family divalent metal transporter [Chloroflexota bacterium]
MSIQPFPAATWAGWLPRSQPAGSGRRSGGARSIAPYLGPAFVVMVGSIDPGNWATDYAAGARYGYQLLWVVLVSTLLLLFFQHLAARLGMLSGKSLAQLVHDRLPRPLAWLFGGSILAASSATTLAEYLGAALGLQILFGLPLIAGAALTAVVVNGLLLTQRYSRLERIVIALVALVAVSYVAQLWFFPPNGGAVAGGLVPRLHDGQLFLVLGILGATVMPHNIYLHSALAQTRDWSRSRRPGRAQLCDTSLGMLLGGALNAAMLLVAAAAFGAGGLAIGSLAETHAALSGVLPAAGQIFGAGLLVAGVASALTSSLCEASTTAGFAGAALVNRHPLFRFGLLLATLPAIGLIARAADPLNLLVWSQVVLSLQLPLTLAPLIWFSRDRALLGSHRLGRWPTVAAVALTAAIVALNTAFLVDQFAR